MEILFLGTSSGTPTKSRNVSAIALIESTSSAWHLIDCGEGTQHQILHSPLSLNSLSSIFITHLHGDHCYGLPGLLASAGLNGRTKPLRIIAPEETKSWIALTQQVSDLHLPYELEFINASDVVGHQFNMFSVSSIPLSHRITSFGYSFTESKPRPSLNVEKIKSKGVPQGPLWGKLKAGNDIEFEGVIYKSKDLCDTPKAPRKIIICGDNDTPDLLAKECKHCDVLVHEATFAEEFSERAKTLGHSYAGLVALFAQNAGLPNLILTHISARYPANPTELERQAKAIYSGNLYLAKDFDRYRLRTDSVLELS